MLSTVVCLSSPILSVCNVGVLWSNGWMDQDETWRAGRPWPQLPLPKGAQSPLIFGPYLLRRNGCMDQDVTWYGARPRPKRLCVRWGPSPTPQKRGGAPSPIFGPFILRPNGWMQQDATWYGGSLGNPKPTI